MDVAEVERAACDCVVGPVGHSDFATIAEALSRTKPGACIGVMPGTYRERIRVFGERKLLGLGAAQSVVLEGDGTVVLGEACTLESLCIVSRRSERLGDAAVVLSGAAQISGAEIRASSDSYAVHIEGAHGPVVLRRVLARGGVRARGMPDVILDDCDVGHGSFEAVHAAGSSQVLLRDCQLRRAMLGGLVCSGASRVRAERCTLSASAVAGVLVGSHGVAELIDCHVLANDPTGVLVLGPAEVTLRGTVVSEHDSDAICIERGVSFLVDCRVHKSGRAGLYLAHGSVAELAGCEVSASVSSGVLLMQGSRLQATGCRFIRSGAEGVAVRGESQAILLDCDLSGNSGPCLDLDPNCLVTYRAAAT